jgi:hypothetical protein
MVTTKIADSPIQDLTGEKNNKPRAAKVAADHGFLKERDITLHPRGGLSVIARSE